MCTRRRRRKQRVHLQNSRRWRTPSQWARWSCSRPRWRIWTLTKRYNRIGGLDMLLIFFCSSSTYLNKIIYSEVHEPPYCQTHLIKFVSGALWKCAQFSSWLEGVPPIPRCVWLTGTVITTSSADWHMKLIIHTQLCIVVSRQVLVADICFSISRKPLLLLLTLLP